MYSDIGYVKNLWRSLVPLVPLLKSSTRLGCRKIKFKVFLCRNRRRNKKRSRYSNRAVSHSNRMINHSNRTVAIFLSRTESACLKYYLRASKMHTTHINFSTSQSELAPLILQPVPLSLSHRGEKRLLTPSMQK